MALVGYGDIGAACGKICRVFGTKIIGVKRRPELISEEHRSYCDELVGNDQLERVYAEADYVVSILPNTPGTDNFFTMENCFSKMKPGSVFMSIGRGQPVNEQDLITALKNGHISGAVMDVYRQEPLPSNSELWSLPNVLMYPHSADNDGELVDHAIEVFTENLALFKAGQPLRNICDKQSGY